MSDDIHFFKSDGGKKTKEISKERKNILNQMAITLKNLRFTQDEIDEVLSIINQAQDDVAYIKDEMEGTNINVSADEAVYATNKKTSQIRERNEKMALDVRAKINQIMQAKG